MRRNLLLLSCLALVALAPAFQAHAQADDDARRRAQADADRKKAEKEKQWATPQAELPAVRAVGPCPFVKVLYDAARYEEFKDPARLTAANVGFTGEITGVRANCQYKAGEPINVQVAIDFALGRGPMAGGSTKDYRYWVAVTERNKSVIAKEDFSVHGEFPAGQDRVVVTDRLDGISIPRANTTTSGANFEVLVGFDVTPEMAAFNRDGKRFRANATAVAAAAPSNSGAAAAR
jgi:hypothetical protein